MTEKRLWLSLFFLFSLTTGYLFLMNERGLDPNREKNWWSLSFAEPREETSLVFVVSNHTASNIFRYTISSDGRMLTEGELSVAPGTDFTHAPTVDFPPQSDRITITVSHEGRDETIYRSL